ncbi:hypothetical protein BKA62DRAFT_628864, partial [Auriculariales sp. MPI-PUGE-AT-0066]
DPFYGYEADANMCAAFLEHHFVCQATPTTSLQTDQQLPPPLPPLANFIAYILYRTRLEPCTMYAAMFFLQRFKSQYPRSRGGSGQKLFLAAYMISTKVLHDNAYGNSSWYIAGQGIFTQSCINQMELQLCLHLDWKLCIDPSELESFAVYLRDEFSPTDRGEQALVVDAEGLA